MEQVKSLNNKSEMDLGETKEEKPMRGARGTPKGSSIVEVETIKEYAGIPVGHRQKARPNDIQTQRMIELGFWKIV